MSHELEARLHTLQDEVRALGREGMPGVESQRLLGVVADLITVVSAILARLDDCDPTQSHSTRAIDHARKFLLSLNEEKK